jgi:hypothetical protein
VSRRGRVRVRERARPGPNPWAGFARVREWASPESVTVCVLRAGPKPSAGFARVGEWASPEAGTPRRSRPRAAGACTDSGAGRSRSSRRRSVHGHDLGRRPFTASRRRRAVPGAGRSRHGRRRDNQAHSGRARHRHINKEDLVVRLLRNPHVVHGPLAKGAHQIGVGNGACSHRIVDG